MAKRLIGTFDPDADGYVHLWHYTCPHLAAKIRHEGVIRPMPQFHLGGLAVVWLADYTVRRPGSETATRALGLPYPRPDDECDKTAAGLRVRVHENSLEFWPDLKKEFPEQWAASLIPRPCKPWLWWLTTRPIYLLEDK